MGLLGWIPETQMWEQQTLQFRVTKGTLTVETRGRKSQGWGVGAAKASQGISGP